MRLFLSNDISAKPNFRASFVVISVRTTTSEHRMSCSATHLAVNSVRTTTNEHRMSCSATHLAVDSVRTTTCEHRMSCSATHLAVNSVRTTSKHRMSSSATDLRFYTCAVACFRSIEMNNISFKMKIPYLFCFIGRFSDRCIKTRSSMA